MSPLFRPQRPNTGLSEFRGDGSKKIAAAITAPYFSGLQVDTASDIVNRLIVGTPPCRFVLYEHAIEIYGGKHFVSNRHPNVFALKIQGYF